MPLLPLLRRLNSLLLAAALLACGTGCAPLQAAGRYDSVDFFRAVEVDNADAIRRMLAQGLDPNLLDTHGQPALLVALQGESLKVARALWEAPGVRIDIVNQAGETPLMMAALKAETDAVAALVARGAAINKDGWSPLHYAATGGSAAIVRSLLARGAALEARSPNQTTPLMMAARYGNEEAVDALLAAGADRTLVNQQGMNASAFAASAGRERLAQRLQPAAAK
jgi:ankyrin repeat protein